MKLPIGIQVQNPVRSALKTNPISTQHLKNALFVNKIFLGTANKRLVLTWDAVKMKTMMNKPNNVPIKPPCLVLLKTRLVILAMQRQLGLILKIDYQEQLRFVPQRLLCGIQFQNHARNAQKNLHITTNRISNARTVLQAPRMIRRRVHVNQANDFEFKLYINHHIKYFLFLRTSN